MKIIIGSIIFVVIIQMTTQAALFLWNRVLVPTGRLFSKVIVSVSIIAGFVLLYVGKESIDQWIEQTFGPEFKWSLVIALGIWAGIKYLRRHRPWLSGFWKRIMGGKRGRRRPRKRGKRPTRAAKPRRP